MDIHALTIGCVRNAREQKKTEGDPSSLALNATVVPCVGQQDDTRYLSCICTWSDVA